MKEVNGVRWYKPREIAKLGLIKSTAGTNNHYGNYAFIMNLIKRNKLKAVNYSTKDRPYYLVSEKEITAYHDTYDKHNPFRG